MRSPPRSASPGKFPTDYQQDSFKFEMVRNPLRQALLFLHNFKEKRTVRL